MPSRKVYGIRKEESEGRKRRREDEESPGRQGSEELVRELALKVDSLISLLQTEKQLKDKMKDFLRCPICLCSPATLPVYISSYCEVLIGCVSCVERWIEGAQGRRCPHCRADGLEFMTIKLRLDPIVGLLNKTSF